MQPEVLEYASSSSTDEPVVLNSAYPLLSLISAIIPFVALEIESIQLLFWGAPLVLIGFIVAISGIVSGRGAGRVLGIVGALLNLPAMYYYYYLFTVGIC
jgi:hypothetical protein